MMPLSILVVDDEPLLAQALACLLTDEGYDVRVAEDGLDAWRKIEHAAPDLLLTDVKMPHLTGLALAQRVRDHGYHFPIVVMSAHTTQVNALGVRFLRKPFELDDLLTTITQLAQDQ